VICDARKPHKFLPGPQRPESTIEIAEGIGETLNPGRISITNDIKYQAEIVFQNANFAPDINSIKVDELAAGK
jgi:hypothetical protein